MALRPITVPAWLAAAPERIIQLWARISTHVQPLVERVGAVTRPVVRVVQPIIDCVTGLGWAILVGGIASWIVAARLGWQEFAIIAAAFLVLFVVACLLTIGRMRMDVTLELTPQRVIAGNPSMARFQLTNSAATPLLGLSVELPVGIAAARYTVPALTTGQAYEDWVTIPTSRRGVVTVGPILTQRGDPFGIVRRQAAWTESIELFIHPRVLPIEQLGTGLLHDLEGQVTADISASDLAFHALREYEPGDDQRHIHWMSSARLSAMSGETRFMVRQFLDTRRSHLAVVADVDPDSYTHGDEFETALSCGASVAVRAITDTMDLSILCGEHRSAQPLPHVALDTFSRATLKKDQSLVDQLASIVTFAPGASLVVVVSGSNVTFDALQRGRSSLPPSSRMVVLRIERDAAIGMKVLDTFVQLTLGRLADLPRALSREVVL